MTDGRKLLNKFYSFKNLREGGKYLSNLSEEEFTSILKLPVGYTGVYLCALRRSFKSSNLNKYIIHVPHASLEVPKEFKEKLLVSEDYFEKENIFISDYKIDEFIPKDFSNVIKFNYSRLFCDVEKYLEDDKEEMSKYGMGAIYTKDSNGRNFIKLDQKYKENIVNNFYKKHHEELDNMVGKILNIYNDCCIIDLHSFSDCFVEKVLDKKDCPDICIGINYNNYDIKLLEKTVNHFSNYDYSIKINYPYAGSIISNKYPDVKSIMIEVNKRVYLKNEKSYDKFYSCMMKYYNLLKRF